MDPTALSLAIGEWLVWGFLALFALAVGGVIAFAAVVRLGVLDTIWHRLGRYLRWRKGK